MIRIGKIVATHGINGSVVLSHIIGGKGWLKADHVVTVEMQKGSFIPYFVSSCKASADNEYIINLEEVNSVESARRLISRHAYVDEALLAQYARQTPLLWIGFKLNDTNTNSTYVIDDVFQTGYQWLARLVINGNEALVPLIEELITKVDLKNKTISIKLPDGLLDVYKK